LLVEVPIEEAPERVAFAFFAWRLSFSDLLAAVFELFEPPLSLLAMVAPSRTRDPGDERTTLESDEEMENAACTSGRARKLDRSPLLLDPLRDLLEGGPLPLTGLPDPTRERVDHAAFAQKQHALSGGPGAH
jgi:hypothetical protein